MDILFETPTKIVGVTHGNRQSLLAQLDEYDEIELVREEHNPHDENAIAVLNAEGKKLGYLRAELAEEITYCLERNPDAVLLGNILEITGGTYGKNYGCNIEVSVVRIQKESAKQQTVSDIMGTRKIYSMDDVDKTIILNKISSLKNTSVALYILGAVALIASIFGFDLAWPIGVFILLVSVIVFAAGRYYSKLATNAKKYLDSTTEQEDLDEGD